MWEYNIRNQFGIECLSRAVVLKWAKASKDGLEIIENKPRGSRLRNLTLDNIRLVEQRILKDCT